MSCYDCDQYSQCTKGENCMNYVPFKFCHKDKSPQQEVASDLFYFVGFVFFVAVICAAAGLGWGLFERFYPSTACMVQQLFLINCK